METLSRPEVPALSSLTDEDGQLALYCCYELHYRGFFGVSDEWEWEPHLLDFRRVLDVIPTEVVDK
jgi:hypothetical protein